MGLKEKIQEDIKTALKGGDQVRTGTLRMLLASMTNKEKEGKEVREEQLEEVVSSEAKKRREAALAFEKGGRSELAEKEKKELEVLLAYLPEQLTKEQIRQLVKEAIAKTGAESQKDIGKVMSALSLQIKGKADGAVVSGIVKESLA